ncbi:MAG TPA: PDZ domain-containing protein [Pirellulales bacterium]|nr:PDZ domain-containing protein [Pirellulales bacterium]
MRQLTSWVVVVSCCGFANGVMAQPALEKLERRLADQPDHDLTAPPPKDVDRGYLGIFADDRNEGGNGVRIVKVIANGPAAQAGLKVGDRVISIEGRKVANMDDFAEAVGPTRAGGKLLFEVERKQERYRLKVTLGQRPPPAQRPVREFGRIPDAMPRSDRPMAILGVVVDEVTADVRETLGLKEARGAVVLRLMPGSPAQQAGVPVEAVIVAVDGEDVDSPADLRRLVAQTGPGGEITLLYVAQGELIERKVRLAKVDAALPELPARPIDQEVDQEPPPADESDQDRIAALEQRVRELEMRLLQLERVLRAAEPAPRTRNSGK